jgi:hypothetical protein
MEALITSTRDLRRELIFNLVSNFVLVDDIYWLVHNLISVTRDADMLKLRRLMDNHAHL